VCKVSIEGQFIRAYYHVEKHFIQEVKKLDAVDSCKASTKVSAVAAATAASTTRTKCF